MGSETSVEQKLHEALHASKLPALDALRAIAVGCVVLNHAGLDFISGSLGVIIFFVLSGFLITWLLLKEYARHDDISLRNFYARRTLRIFPAFLVYWALVMGLAWVTDYEFPTGQAAAAFFYVNNYYQAALGDPGTPFSHTWSLGIEEQFYLVWPGVALLLLARGRSLVPFLVTTILMVWCWRTVLNGWLDAGTWAQYAFDARADHLLIGCLLAVLLHRGACQGLFAVLCRSPYLPLVTIAALCACIHLFRSVFEHNRFGLDYIIEPVLVAALIPQLMAHHQHLLWRWMSWRWVVYLGMISYSTYLYQQIVVVRVMRQVDDLPSVLAYGIVIAAVVLVASGSYYVIERPCLRLKRVFER